MRQALPFAAALMGGSSLLLQVLLARELITSFAGNELAVPVVLFVWLLGVAGGSRLATRLLGQLHGAHSLAVLQVLLAVWTLGVVPVGRFAGAQTAFTGQTPSILSMLALTALTIVPGCLVLGAQFTFACRAFETRRCQGAVSRVYALESAGAMAAGLAWHFVFAERIGALGLCMALAAINAACAVWLSHASARRRRSTRAVSLAGICLAAASCAGLASAPLGSGLNSWALGLRWRDFTVVESVDSRFANLTVTANASQTSLFQDGALIATSDDLQTAEWSAHLPMLQLKRPGDVLLVGLGHPLVWQQVLKHRPRSVTVVEADPALARLASLHLGAPQGRVVTADARSLLRRSHSRFDAIILNVHDPSTAALNRFYTEEFFRVVRERLAPGGVFALSLTGVEGYLATDRQVIHAAVYRALQAVFRETMVVPGHSVQFVCAAGAGTLCTEAQVLSDRLRTAGIRTEFLSPFGLKTALAPFARDVYLDAAHSADAAPNRDLRPATYSGFLRLWMRQWGLDPGPVIGLMGHLYAGRWVLPGIGLLLGLLGFAGRVRLSGLRLSVGVAGLGFALMGGQLGVVIGFQILAGSLYHQLALLLALHMAGLALGGWLAGRAFPARRPGSGYLICALLVCALTYPLGGLLACLSQVPELVALALGALAFALGTAGGAAFPCAVARLLVAEGGGLSRAAGRLYAWDLLGGAVAAATVGVALIPALGLVAAPELVAHVGLMAALIAAPACLACVPRHMGQGEA